MYNVIYHLIYADGTEYSDTVPYFSIPEAEKEIDIFMSDPDPMKTGMPVMLGNAERLYKWS